MERSDDQSSNSLDKQAALMILYELLGKPPYVPEKAKPQKSPPRKKPDDIPGAALDRVRSQLRRDALKAKEPIVNESQQSQNHRKPISPEEKKIAVR